MPGSTTDTVPTMLTPGEFVIKRESAKMLGKPFLEQLNAVSDNSAHSNIDALISQAALAQMQPMEGGGVVNEYMGGGDVSNYMGGGDVMNYRYGGGVMDKKKKKMAGYQEGGDVGDLTAEDLAFMNMSEDVSGVEDYLSPEVVFGKDYKNLSPEELDFRAEGFRDIFQKLRLIQEGDFSNLWDLDDKGQLKGKGYDGVTGEDARELDYLFSNIRELAKEQAPGYKRPVGDMFVPETRKPTAPAMRRYLESLLMNEPLIKEFNVKSVGLQRGGAVGDATSVSLEGLLSELQKKKPISNYSMVDADRVDAENQEILNAIMDSVMPGGAIGSIKQTGKLVPLAKKFASLAPDKGKQKVLDKIASEMNLAPSRKVIQNPSRNLYDYKDYKVVERKPESFDAMDLINRGYLQKYTNKLVRNMNPSGSVKLGDIVDAPYASNMRGGYYNINEMAKEVIKLPKKERIKAAKDLLNYFNINLKNVRGKQDGGEVADSLFGMSMDDFNKILANELLESSMTGENLPKRIELSPEEDKFRNNPNPDKPFGMTILDDLLLRAYEQYRFGRLPSMKD